MKNFLSGKKKAPPEPLNANIDAFQALSFSQPSPQVTSPGLKKSASRWKRQKKPVEVKPEINVAAALPPTDDFRTSLMMPSFTARFSMLREQDDPNSLLGKAMDDSVLQPRRKSRMDFGTLGDIAEVSSIRSQVRPPFAYGRQDSFASEDGYGSETDSQGMMSRARPGEGNTLFGGRQKVYMIPKAGASSTRSLGKVRYEDDIGMSAFQRYKQEMEREARANKERTSDESQSFDFGLDNIGQPDYFDGHSRTPNDSAKDLSHSPSLSSYDRKRSTASTSHSEAPSSTVATSIASQPTSSFSTSTVQAATPTSTAPSALKRSDTKTRRLYEQGLDQHMYEQQASAMTRLNSIQRQRGLNNGKQSPPYLHGTKSAGNLHEKARQPVYALRPQSPEAFLNNFGSIRNPTSNTSSPNLSGPVSPLTPHDLDANGSAALTQALEPADRGKATAMGAFNKPNTAFDENQYLERQRQLQRSTSNAAAKKQAAPAIPQHRMDRFDFERERSDSDTSIRSQSRGANRANDQAQTTAAYNVFQRAAQMNAGPGAQQYDKTNVPDAHRTFFGNISASDSEEDEDETSRYNQHQYGQSDYGYGYQPNRWQPTPLPSVSEHPALRNHKSQPSLAEADEDEEAARSDSHMLPPLTHIQSRGLNQAGLDHESLTLGTNTGATPLNGLMHHLRQQSNQSEITQAEEKQSLDEVPEIPEWNPKNLDLIHRPTRTTTEPESRIGSTYTSSNPFDLEERENPSRIGERTSHTSVSPIEGNPTFSQFDSRAPSITTFAHRQSDVSQLTPEADEETSWQNELQRQHTRDASTATQQEREAFQSELDARKVAAQESILQRINQSRNVSPAPSSATPSAAGFRGFGMLRSRPSRESVDNGQRTTQAPPKAMKMLGLSGGAANGGNSNGSTPQYERTGYSLDIGRTRELSVTRPPLPDNPPRAFQQTEREWQQNRSRENSESRPMTNGRSPASSAGGRSRANSEAAGGRSRSRTGPYRDDLDKAMVEGVGSRTDTSPMIPHELTPRASPDVGQGPFDQRARSNSRPQQPSGYFGAFDAKSLQPIQTGSRDRLAPNGPSPITLSPNVYTPSGRPSPVSPFASNMTPPLSGANTPMSSTFASTAPPSSSSSSGRPNGVLRKKTISKGDISEPTLIMSTSNIDTVDLPEGASLRNGMNEPPPLPPINPRRRATKAIFGIGQRKDFDDTNSPPNQNSRSKTPDPWVPIRPAEADFPYDPHTFGNREARSSPRLPSSKQSFDQSPAMRQNGFGAPSNGSPERGARQHAPHSIAMDIEGGMF